MKVLKLPKLLPSCIYDSNSSSNKGRPLCVGTKKRTSLRYKNQYVCVYVCACVSRCQWADEDCSAANFTTTLTSNGVCFTFNKVVRPQGSLTIKASGNLRIILITSCTFNKVVRTHGSLTIKASGILSII